MQVETPHGRRVKIKAANVLLQFDRPAAAKLLFDPQQVHVKPAPMQLA